MVSFRLPLRAILHTYKNLKLFTTEFVGRMFKVQWTSGRPWHFFRVGKLQKIMVYFIHKKWLSEILTKPEIKISNRHQKQVHMLKSEIRIMEEGKKDQFWFVDKRVWILPLVNLSELSDLLRISFNINDNFVVYIKTWCKILRCVLNEIVPKGLLFSYQLPWKTWDSILLLVFSIQRKMLKISNNNKKSEVNLT